MHKLSMFALSGLLFVGSCFASQEINITNLDKYKILKALFYVAKPKEFNSLQQYNSKHELTNDLIDNLVRQNGGRWDFYCIAGRSLGIDINGDSFNPWFFDRYNGTGTAQQVIDNLQT